MYELYNKDQLWATFEVTTINGFEVINMLQEDRQKIYPWITDVAKFIANRKAPKHRKHIANLLKQCGCDTIRGYLNVQHALQLNDTIWVKQVNQRLSWQDVQLYQHQFNQTIARVAFEGGLFGQRFQQTSPEFGTNGTFAKCWVREDSKIKLIKQGQDGYQNSGLEPYSEFYASQVLSALGLRHVNYGLTYHKGKLASKCECFTDEKYGLLPYSFIDPNASILDLAKFYNSLNANEDLANMLIADAVILNQDRHLGNFGFIVENDTGKIVATAPLYDHNIQLLCYATDDNLKNTQQLLEYIESNNVGPKLYDEFLYTARQVLTSKMRKRLISVKGFKFKRHSRYNLQEERLERLNRIVNNQIDSILR